MPELDQSTYSFSASVVILNPSQSKVTPGQRYKNTSLGSSWHSRSSVSVAVLYSSRVENEGPRDGTAVRLVLENTTATTTAAVLLRECITAVLIYHEREKKAAE